MKLPLVTARMDELGIIARRRMDMIAHYPEKSYAEIMHLSQAELEEMLQIRLMLPSNGEERRAAQERIKEKIKMRKIESVVDAEDE